MRNLNNKDLFQIMRIMKKANIKDKLAQIEMPRDEEGNATLSGEQYGMKVILEIIESAPDAEKDIFKFLADIGEVDQKELEQDEFDLLPQIIEHLQGQKKLMSFLERAFKSVS